MLLLSSMRSAPRVLLQQSKGGQRHFLLPSPQRLYSTGGGSSTAHQQGGLTATVLLATAVGIGSSFLETNTTTRLEEKEKPAKKASSVLGWFTKKEAMSPEKKALISHPNVSTWQKGNRQITILGARGYSTESAKLAKELVQVLRPQAVFVDVDQHVFVNFGIYEQVKAQLAESGVSTDNLKIHLEEEVEEGAYLTDIPSSSRNASKHEAIANLIKAMFIQLKYAGIASHEEKAPSGAHFINAFAEGHKIGANLVLGGRNYDVTQSRTDQAIEATTSDVPSLESMDLMWHHNASDRENYRRISQEIQKALPMFHKVIVTELDHHLATKLNLIPDKTIVAIVMMLHMDGVEEELKQCGWKLKKV